MAIDSVNPTTGEVIETFAETSPAALEASLAGAWDAFVDWRRVPFAGRAERLRAAARILRVRKVDFARTMALEMGKPIAQGEAEVEKCAWVCEYYAEHAARASRAESRAPTDATRSYVRFDPLGVVLAVMPWNFPFWQVFRFAAPALMAGNAAPAQARLERPAAARSPSRRSSATPASRAGVFRTLLVGAARVRRS